MKVPKPRWSNIDVVLFVAIAIGLCIYWVQLLRESLRVQYGEDPQQLFGFLSWLLGYVVIFLGLCLLGWLNYKGPFRYLARSPHRWFYYSWMLVLLGIVFELLQWRTFYELELREENFLVALLCLVFMAGFTLVLDMASSRRERAELMQQKTAAELNSLRAQLNPHFLFNALNTIYSEALQQGHEKLSQLIGELSGILRFSLRQAQQEVVSVKDEIVFLQRYINLQRARLPENAHRQLDIVLDWDEQPAFMAPLLLIPFVENAFQYGLHPTQSCFIRMLLVVENGILDINLQNSLIKPQLHKGAGLGIDQVRQRLDKLYPHRHQLQIEATADAFSVHLTLSLDTTVPLPQPI